MSTENQNINVKTESKQQHESKADQMPKKAIGFLGPFVARKIK
jgi:hypothetical protein